MADKVLLCVYKDYVHDFVASQLKIPIVFANQLFFADGEIKLAVDDPDDLRDKQVIIVYSTCPPVSATIITLALLTDLARSAQAFSITAVVPYFGYSRQVEGSIEGEPGAAFTIVRMLEAAGINRFICVELHDAKIEPYFHVPLTNVSLVPLIAAHIQSHFGDQDYCLVAPDNGAIRRVQEIAALLNKEVITYSKQRFNLDTVTLKGSPHGSFDHDTAIIIDDILDTGNTALEVVDDLYSKGISSVNGYFIHAVLAPGTLERVQRSGLKRIFVSNTIKKDFEATWIEIFDYTPALVPWLKSL